MKIGLKFRIREDDSHEDLEDDYLTAKYKEYQQYLNQFNMKNKDQLWEYFASDFFHDGTINELRFSEDMHSIIMKIDCPNIKVLSDDK